MEQLPVECLAHIVRRLDPRDQLALAACSRTLLCDVPSHVRWLWLAKCSGSVDLSFARRYTSLESLMVTLTNPCGRTRQTCMDNACRLHAGRPPPADLQPTGLHVLPSCLMLSSLMLEGDNHGSRIVCRVTADLSPIARIPHLTRLVVAHHACLVNWSALGGLAWAKLASLELSRCERLTSLAGLDGCTTLTTLTVRSCKRLKDTSAIMRCGALKNLCINLCSSVRTAAALRGCTALTHLELSFCMKDISGVRFCTALESLCLQYLDDDRVPRGLTSLGGPVCRLPRLTSLHVPSNAAAHLGNILANLPTLTRLRFPLRCKALTDLSAITACTALQELIAMNQPALRDVSALRWMGQLRTLNLSECDALVDTSPIGALTALTKLDMLFCQAVVDVSPLARCAALRHLRLCHCDAIADLTPIRALTALTQLDLSVGNGAPDISPLMRCSTLARAIRTWRRGP